MNPDDTRRFRSLVARAEIQFGVLHRTLRSMQALLDGNQEKPKSGKLANLSRRETEVMKLLWRGWSCPEIACEMKISVHTVRNHTRSIERKLGVHTRAQLMRFFL